MTTFYICRHGETENNKHARLSGWIDTPLTDEGVRGVQSSAKKLYNIRFDTVYSSDLGRAFITAYIIVRYIGFAGEIYRQKELREVHYGDYANLLWNDVLPKDKPDLFNDTHFMPPNGETLAHMQERVVACVMRIEKDHKGQTILLSSHDGPINALYAHFADIDLGQLMKVRVNPHDFVGKFEVENGRIASFAAV